MISALLEAYKILGLDGARDRALQTLDLLLAKAYDPRQRHGSQPRAHRSEANGSAVSNFEFRVSNFDLLDDQVFMAAALLDAYEVTGRKHYFDRRSRADGNHDPSLLGRRRRGLLRHRQGSRRSARGALQSQRKAFQDSPTPAANSVAAAGARPAGSARRRVRTSARRRKTILDLFAPKARDYGLFAATYALALCQSPPPADWRLW